MKPDTERNATPGNEGHTTEVFIEHVERQMVGRHRYRKIGDRDISGGIEPVSGKKHLYNKINKIKMLGGLSEELGDCRYQNRGKM